MSTGQEPDAGGQPATLDRSDLVARLGRQARRLGDVTGAFSQRVAERAGLASNDVQCLVHLAVSGATPSGRLAEITGLSPGAATRMIDRLEQAGYVRRTPDPADRRVVVVELTPGRIDPIAARFEALDRAIGAATAGIAADRIADVTALLDRIVEQVQIETVRLDEHAAPPLAGGSAFSAPLGGVTVARLVFVSAVPSMVIRGDTTLPDLYRASFEGPIPRVRVRAGVVTVRYARFAWFDWRARIGDQMIDTSVHWRTDRGQVAMNTGVPWAIELRGGGSRVRAELADIELASFELAGGASRVELVLAPPRGIIPIRLAGSLNDVLIGRPNGVAARLRLSGPASRVDVDGQVIAPASGNIVLETPGASQAADRYEIEIRGPANRVLVANTGGAALEV